MAAYEAFLATQTNTSEDDYQEFKSKYATPARRCSNVELTGNILSTEFELTAAPCLGLQEISKVVLKKNDHGNTPTTRQKTPDKVIKAIKPKINTCKISCIFTSIDEGSYDVASNTLSSQTILNAIRRYAVQYNIVSVLCIPQVPQGVSLLLSPIDAVMASTSSWLDAINDYDRLDDRHYIEWQEFILHKGSKVEVESNDWLEETLCLSMESNLCAKVESDMKGLFLTNEAQLQCFVSSSSVWSFATRKLGILLKTTSNHSIHAITQERMSLWPASSKRW